MSKTQSMLSGLNKFFGGASAALTKEVDYALNRKPQPELTVIKTVPMREVEKPSFIKKREAERSNRQAQAENDDMMLFVKLVQKKR
jgi:hypothetical protein